MIVTRQINDNTVGTLKMKNHPYVNIINILIQADGELQTEAIRWEPGSIRLCFQPNWHLKITVESLTRVEDMCHDAY